MNRAFARVGVRLHVGPSAFGNALGSSIADSIATNEARAKYLAEDQMRSGIEDAAAAQYAYEQSEKKAAFRDSALAGLGSSGGASRALPYKGVSEEEVAIFAKVFGESRGKFAAVAEATNASKYLPESGIGAWPFAGSDGRRQAGPISAVGGFDVLGNSLNSSQFDIGRSWLGDAARAPVNLFANTVEFVGNNLNLSFTQPGDIDYISFMDWMKQPYATGFGSYAEFGMGMGLAAFGYRGSNGSGTVGAVDMRAESAASTYGQIARNFSSSTTGEYSARLSSLPAGEFGLRTGYSGKLVGADTAIQIPAQFDFLAARYAESRNGGEVFTWERFATETGVDPSTLNRATQSAIRNRSRELDLMPRAPVDSNRVADFSAWNTEIVERGSGLSRGTTVYLPETTVMPYGRHFDYLDSLFVRPDGYLWDHMARDGHFQAVQRGVHATTPHKGFSLWTNKVN